MNMHQIIAKGLVNKDCISKILRELKWDNVLEKSTFINNPTYVTKLRARIRSFTRTLVIYDTEIYAQKVPVWPSPVNVFKGFDSDIIHT